MWSSTNSQQLQKAQQMLKDCSPAIVQKNIREARVADTARLVLKKCLFKQWVPVLKCLGTRITAFHCLCSKGKRKQQEAPRAKIWNFSFNVVLTGGANHVDTVRVLLSCIYPSLLCMQRSTGNQYKLKQPVSNYQERSGCFKTGNLAPSVSAIWILVSLKCIKCQF